jgi:hypothetical protein
MNAAVNDLLVELLTARVTQVVSNRARGHCVRIDDAPLGVATECCVALQDRLAPTDTAVVVSSAPTSGYERTPTQVVELRNRSDLLVDDRSADDVGVLVVFVPPQERLTVEDSIGASTFERIGAADLGTQAWLQVVDRLRATSPELAEAVDRIGTLIRNDTGRFEIDDVELAAYGLRAAELARDESIGIAAAAGLALPAVGLLPDRGLDIADIDDTRRRLQLNDQQVDTLSLPIDPADRIRQLPIDPGSEPALAAALFDAIADGTIDRTSIALNLQERTEIVDLAAWQGLREGPPAPGEFIVVKFVGDIEQTSVENVVSKSTASIGVEFICRPPAGTIPDASLRIDVIVLGDTDDAATTSFTKRSGLPQKARSTIRKRLTCGDSDADLPAGIYQLRLSLLAHDGTTLAQSESDMFRVGEVERQATPAPVSSLLDAHVAAVLAAKAVPEGRKLTAAMDDVERFVAHLDVQYTDIARRWAIDVPHRLAELEAQLLEEPETVRGLELDLGSPEREHELVVFDHARDGAFVAARRDLFLEIAAVDPAIDTGGSGATRPNLALVALPKHRELVDRYVRTWIEELGARTGVERRELLDVDRLVVRDKHGEAAIVMLAPTHPLRIAWLLQRAVATDMWIDEVASMDRDVMIDEARELDDALPNVVADELPPIVAEGSTPLRYRSALPGGWAVWASTKVGVEESLEAQFYDWLGIAKPGLRRSGETEILQRLRAYLASHPYVRTLVLNVVRGGRGEFVLRLVGSLSNDDPDLRFLIRLFGDDDPELGKALADFMIDPDGAGLDRKSAERLTRVGRDPLRPRVAFSTHGLDEMRDNPSRYPSHLSVFLDFFDLVIQPVVPPPHGRSVFGNGIVIGTSSTFDPGNPVTALPPRWFNTVNVSPGARSLVESALLAHHSATSTVLGGLPGTVPGLRLDLDVRTQSILDAVHDASDWVIVIDSVFSDQYFDTAKTRSDEVAERFVVDSQGVSRGADLRNVVVSSKLRHERAATLSAAAEDYGLVLDEAARDVLLNGLHVLGAGLGLRLLADDRRRVEALSLSLASAFLDEQGILRHALVLPVDEYAAWFVEASRLGEIRSRTRTDLMIVRLDPAARKIAVTLVEVKVRGDLGEHGGVPLSLVENIAAQLRNTSDVVRRRLFGAHLRERPGSLSAALRLRRLTAVLRRHLDRAALRGYLDGDTAEGHRAFIDSLDRGFGLSIDLRGLVFHLGGTGLATQQIDGIDIDVAGRDRVSDLFQNPDRAATQPALGGDYLRTVFGARGEQTQIVASASPPEDELDGASGAPDEETSHETHAATVLEPDEGIQLQDVDLVGHASTSNQFSVVGTSVSSHRFAAIDVGGTNVVSVFGVQGSGKSYTVGALVESGLVGAPRLARLPHPLATVVFHFSSDASYRSEFGTLGTPTSDTPSIAWLADHGESPAAVRDVVVLVARRQLDRRRAEYQGLRVEPLAIGASELTFGDWKLLMGIDGGRQMYARALGLVLRQLEDGFTLDDFRQGIEQTDLAAGQKSLALARLEFVAEHLADTANVTQWLRPGRLLIIDVRDDLIDKDEALSLFMVLLNRFAETSAPDRFNKMIVFDEAHKYMNDSSLTDAITEAVREMRHKGVTLVISSQDPPSVPSVVVELSTVIVAHRMSAPTWLRALQRSSQAFADVKPGDLAVLRNGQALLWSSGGSARYRTPQRIQVRPRLTEHGGHTIRVD